MGKKHGFTVTEIAEFLSRSPQTVRNMIGAGEIEVVKFGNAWLISPQAFFDFLDNEKSDRECEIDQIEEIRKRVMEAACNTE